MTTWAKFFFYAGKWHFSGFTEHEKAVAEFEDFCAGEGVISVVLALRHPPARVSTRMTDTGLPPGRRIQQVETEGERL